MKKKEIYWLLGTLLLFLMLTLVIFGMDGFNSDAKSVVNIHDTYFVLANIHVIPLILVLTFFVVYLWRAIAGKFRNSTANLILMTVTILSVLVIGKLLGIVDQLRELHPIEPVVLERSPVAYIIAIVSKIMLVLQVALLILLGYSGFRTGQHYKRTS